MTELTTYMSELYIPQHIAPYQYGEVEALIAMGCDGGDGEFDLPSDAALKALLRVPILEWECLTVNTNPLVKCIVLEDVRIALPDTGAEIIRHLIRYLTNTEKRTGQKWEVVERYKTSGPPWRIEYDRALLRAADGSTVRIYYRGPSRCWVRGQKVLPPNEAYLMEKYAGGVKDD